MHDSKKAAQPLPEGSGSEIHFRLDNALKLHFSKREELPYATREALREKLYAAAATKRGFATPSSRKGLIGVAMAPCAIFIAVLLLITVNMLLGMWAAIIIVIGYYLVSIVSGAIIVAASLATTNNRIMEVIT